MTMTLRDLPVGLDVAAVVSRAVEDVRPNARNSEVWDAIVHALDQAMTSEYQGIHLHRHEVLMILAREHLRLQATMGFPYEYERDDD